MVTTNPMSVLRCFLILLAVIVLPACKIIQTVPDGGSIQSRTGERDCPAQSECTIEIAGGEFSDTFIAVADEGFEFTGWFQDDRYLCGGSADPCALENVPDSLTSQDITLFLHPVFTALEDEIDPIAGLLPNCENGSLVWNGAVQYGFDGDLTVNGAPCATATGFGESLAFIDGDEQNYLSFGNDAYVSLPDSLAMLAFQQESLEFSFRFRIPADVDIPDRPTLFAFKESWASDAGGVAVRVHSEPWGSQLIVNFSDGTEAGGVWAELFDSVELGAWNTVQLVFDLILMEWHLIYNDEHTVTAMPDAFDAEAFLAALRERDGILGSYFAGRSSEEPGSFDIDDFRIYSPAALALDSDSDRDGVRDSEDAFPQDPDETLDSDGDGIGNNADEDDDNDGVIDTEDQFPLDPGLISENDRTPKPVVPSADDRSFNRAWQPALAGECQLDGNVSPSIAVSSERLAELGDGRAVYEPAILFADETFTLMKKLERQESSVLLDSVAPGAFEVVGSDADLYLYDDGSHGDITAGDGVYTRACLSLQEQEWPESDVATFEAFFVNPSLRGTETVQELDEGVRINDTGLFISLGDSYRSNLDRHWYLFNPDVCVACQHAWHSVGDVFDFFVMSPREAWGGAGYTRVHDFIEGTGFAPEHDNFSVSGEPMIDGKEHAEYAGMIWMGWPLIGGLTHELGHGVLGIETTDFPGEGVKQWNSGDGFHIDSDTTVRGDLQGPVWDPDRGWPYPVRLNDGSDSVWDYPEVYLDVNSEGLPYLKVMDADRFIWSDIFLYMMGLLSVDETDETYFKLVNPVYSDCETTPNFYVCSGTAVSAEEIIEFSTADLVEKYGPWTNHSTTYDPARINIGVLNVSDRQHTEAEIVLLSRQFRHYATSESETVINTTEYTWWWSTRGLSEVNFNFVDHLTDEN